MEERTVVDPGFATQQGPGTYPGDATQVMGGPYSPPAAPPAGGFAYGEATQHVMAANCPVCGTPNPPAERYCQDCGLLFGSVTQVEPLPDLSLLPRLVDSGGREFQLNPGLNLVGREGADVSLGDPTVSRRHAQVTVENGTAVVEDLGSTNGTKVGDRRLAGGERATAYHGDPLKFGNLIVTLQLPGGSPRPAALPAPAEPALPVEDRGAPLGHFVAADGTEFPLYAGINTIGRRSANHVVLADAFASGKHAELNLADGTATLTDLGSTNGTFINGERLAPQAPVTLAEGTVVTFAKLPLTYCAATSAAPEATLMADRTIAGLSEEVAAEAQVDPEAPSAPLSTP